MSDNQALLREIDAEIECWSGVASSGQTVFAGQMTSLLTRCREALSAQPAEPKWRPIPKRGEPVELTSGPLQPIAAEPKEIRRTEYTPGGHPVSVVYDAPAAEPVEMRQCLKHDCGTTWTGSGPLNFTCPVCGWLHSRRLIAPPAAETKQDWA